MVNASPGGLLGGRYQLREKIGYGAYGEVWRAWDQNRSHEIALKLLFRGRPADAWVEASLLTQLRSPYILEVNNADVIVDVPFLDTALAKDSLDRICSPHGLEPHLAVESVRRALRGLTLCHARGLIHRDVKPANIFQRSNGDIVLGDFGAAAVLDESGAAPAAGDPRIRAPEALATGRQGVAADVYGAGVTLFWAIAARWPFDQEMQVDLDRAIGSGVRPDLREIAPHVSLALAKVIDRAMHLDPEKRYRTAAEFDSALGHLPTRTNRFTPIEQHEGHQRCWTVDGKSSLHVCVVVDEVTRVEVAHRRSGRRLVKYCQPCPVAKTNATLKKVFDQLRMA